MNVPTPSLPDHVDHLAAAVAGIGSRRSAGSGVIWRPGVLVTSATLLWRAPRLAVLLPGGEQVPGEVRGHDPGTDLAAVSFVDPGTPAATVDRSSAAAAPRVGDFVFAVGRTASGMTQASFGHVGAVAGEWRTWRGGRVEQLVRLDGGLYPGLAGAAVGNAAGQLIGIASPALSRHHGVVLPAATVDRVLDLLLAHGRVPHGYLGIAAQGVRATLDGLAVDGLLVSSVAAESPAARAGLQVGDVIVEVAGAAAASMEDLRDRLQVGARVPLRVSRGGVAQQIDVEVAQRPSSRCG